MPKGDKGDTGLPSILSLSFISIGMPITEGGASYVELGRFPFGNNISTPFTGIRTNIWVDAGVGSFRIRDLISGNVVYENANITSTSAINIEKISGVSVYDVADALLAVEFKHNTGAGSFVSCGGISFHY